MFDCEVNILYKVHIVQWHNEAKLSVDTTRVILEVRKQRNAFLSGRLCNFFAEEEKQIKSFRTIAIILFDKRFCTAQNEAN